MTSETDQEMGAAGDPAYCAPSAQPVAFGDCAGLLHPAGGDTGVLLCSPWGYEELCARKTWRRLADAIAAAGYPCLRFDYPGAGDSLGAPADIDGLERWTGAIARAAETLAERTGVRRVVLVGQGLGAALAVLAARDMPDLAGIGLLAPVSKGRSYLRELAAWESMIASANGLAPAEGSATGVSIAGFEMSAPVAAAIKQLDVLQAVSHLSPAPALVLARPGRAPDAALAEALQSRGGPVRQLPYLGMEALLTDPTTAQTPTEALDAVVGWLAETFPHEPGRVMPLASPPSASLRGAHFHEEAFHFGPKLLGVFCQPEAPRTRRVVLMLNGGYDYHIGWARMAVDHARALAAEGVASLRIDAAGVGDSPGRVGAPEQVLYSDLQVHDVVDALDWLQARGFDEVLIAGRCSGAYLGFAAAVADRRVRDLIMVNPLRFVWDPRESVDEAIRFRSFGHYRAKALQPQTLKRILAGQVNVRGVAGRLAREGFKSAAASVSSLFGRGPGDDLQAQALARFAALRDCGVAVSLAYSDAEEEGIERCARLFGKDGAGLAAYPNMSVSMIEGADHNLTPKPARDWLLAHTLERALARPVVQAPSVAA